MTPYLCLSSLCRSPIACSTFGYCRERNFDGAPVDEANNARRQRDQEEAQNIAEHVSAERERCAKIAEAHKGAASRQRRTKAGLGGRRLGELSEFAQIEIQAEERGEDIAAETIAREIRKDPTK